MNALNPSRKLAARPRPGCFLDLLILTGLLAVVMPLRADNPPTYVFQIQGYDLGIAVDGSNYVYASGSFVGKFDEYGDFLTQLGTNNPFLLPVGITVDSANNVYVVDEGHDYVQKFDGNGNYLLQWGSTGSGNGQFSSPYFIAVDRSDNIYVSDLGNNRIEKFDSMGNYLLQWGSYGSANGQFNSPQGVACDSSNNVYVADSGNARVEEFDSSGKYLTQWGSYGTNNGQFWGPLGLAIDGHGHVYVTDFSSDRVQTFDGAGNYLAQWGSFGTNNGQFENPYGIAISGNGLFIYVCDGNGGRLEAFALDTNVIRPFITSQPASQTVPEGLNVTLSVAVVGGPPLAFQWTSNNVPMPNATNDAISLASVSLSASNAVYAVQVTNAFGLALSSNAVVTVTPTLVYTLPPSGISAAGAVLRGSVDAGIETLAWFEWGADTNYGNIAGVTNLLGAATASPIANALNGLDAALIYHYRAVVSNSFGIVYGSDQSFQVGLRSVLVNVFASNVTSNSATLNAIVNPEGPPTSVFFNWGIIITNHPAPVAVGSGTADVVASLPVAGLIPGAVYQVSVVASNRDGTANSLYRFQALPWNWNQTSASYQNWQSIASSADGNMLAAAAYGGPILTSTNAGLSWNTNSQPGSNWISVASSADGRKLVAAIGGFFSYQATGPILISSNAGLSWSNTSAPLWRWTCVASSADGNKLAAVAQPSNGSGGGICTSSDGGATWITNNAPATNWICIASSADGNNLVAAVYGGRIYTSTNGGGTWSTNNVPLGNWQSVASSADGNKLAAAQGGYSLSPGFIYTSPNGGATWIKQTNAPSRDWFSVASSADGNKLVALAFGVSGVVTVTNCIFTSTNAGAIWAPSDAPSTLWECVASSADGSKLAAVVNITGGTGGTGFIYNMQTTPSPVLNLSASANDTAISWLIPSLDFTLQQSPDLSNWTAVTNSPTLNLTNLENQVLLPLPAGNAFYRLKY